VAETMLAAVLEGPRRLVVRAVPRPRCGAGEVLVRMAVCGVCGSDLRYFEGENPWAIHTLGVDRPNLPGMILGHEVAGTIVAVGEGVSPDRVGQRVVAEAFRTCGSCPDCLRGRANLCASTEHLGHGAGWEGAEFNPGGMSECFTIWEDKALSLPDSITFEEAAFLDGLGVAVHAVRRAQVREGDAVLIWGAGPIGLCLAQVARAWGARLVACVDVYPVAMRLAEELGADVVADARSTDALTGLMDRTAGRGADAVFDTTGDLAAQQSALAALAPGGTCLLMAGPAPGLQVGLRALAGERTLTTAANFADGDLAEALRLVESGQVRVRPMITHRVPLARAPEAFELMRQKERHATMKVLIVSDE